MLSNMLSTLLLLHSFSMCAGMTAGLVTTYVRTSNSRCEASTKGVEVELFPNFVTTQFGSTASASTKGVGTFELHFEDKDPTTGRAANSTADSPVVATGSVRSLSTDGSANSFQFSGFCAVNCAGRECGFLNPSFCDCAGLLSNINNGNGMINVICKVNGATACAGMYAWVSPAI